jgi:hypothetical protein
MENLFLATFTLMFIILALFFIYLALPFEKKKAQK